jgi:hypothetical protein
MARYIDADKFIKQFERALEHQKKYGLYNHAKLTEYVIKAIENEPTADVVPKSEVEGLRNDIDISYEYGKIDAAREIFEEIEKILIDSAYIPDCARFVDIDELAELKKKYTEDKKYEN